VASVATPERHRGQGYGGAATAHAVRASGATGAFLQSSPIGESVYRGLGFTTQEHWRQWMPSQYLG
jgi:predicted GNAT family acetyltransferase